MSRLTRVALLTAPAFLAAPAWAQAGPPASATEQAQTSDESGLGEIVVTAQKRSENLQKVPIAVAVVTSDQLVASGVSDIRSLKLATPGVDIQTLTGFALPIIRGVGSKATIAGVEPPVAFYIDGVYYATATSTLLAFNNISQIEVLKGPQGTLFGRNATGGLIQVTTRDPKSETSGDVSLSYGNYDTLSANGYVTGGIAPGIAADIALHISAMGKGYGKNLFNGDDVYKTDEDFGVRSKWLFSLGAGTEARVIGDFSRMRNSFNALRIKEGTTVPAPFGPAYGGSAWDIDTDQQPETRLKTGGVSLRIDQELGDYKVASISAYRETDTAVDFDVDYTRPRGRFATYLQKDWQFSQELQLLSPTGGALEWVAGAYYFRADSTLDFYLNLAGPAISPTALTKLSYTRATQGTDSLSGFGQASLRLLDRLKLTAGLRYTSEKRSLDDASVINTRTDDTVVVATPPRNVSKRFNKLTWRLALDYQLTPDALVYASYNRGFKSGGYNANSPTLPPFNPEVLDAYEVGLKTEFLDRRVRLNLAGFYYDYADVQVQRPSEFGTGLYNSGNVELYGGEAELTARPIDALTIRASYQYLHGKYKNFPIALVATPRPAGGYTIGTGSATGNDTVLTPESTFSLNSSYVIPLGSSNLTVNGGWYYNSGFYHEPDNLVRQPAYSLFNASLRYETPEGLSLMLWGNNLSNKAVSIFNGIQVFGATGANRITYAPPRTYGVTLGFKY